MTKKKWKVTVSVNGIKGNIIVRAYNEKDIINLFNNGFYIDKNDNYTIHNMEYIDK